MHTSESKIYIQFQDMITKILLSHKYNHSIKTQLIHFSWFNHRHSIVLTEQRNYFYRLTVSSFKSYLNTKKRHKALDTFNVELQCLTLNLLSHYIRQSLFNLFLIMFCYRFRCVIIVFNYILVLVYYRHYCSSKQY